MRSKKNIATPAVSLIRCDTAQLLRSIARVDPD
jgi:hypothetical protein